MIEGTDFYSLLEMLLKVSGKFKVDIDKENTRRAIFLHGVVFVFNEKESLTQINYIEPIEDWMRHAARTPHQQNLKAPGVREDAEVERDPITSRESEEFRC